MTIQRFAKDGTDRSMKILDQERIAGKRANYHVYYRKANGKNFVDAAYCDTAQDVTAFIVRNVRNAVILGVLPTVPVSL